MCYRRLHSLEAVVIMYIISINTAATPIIPMACFDTIIKSCGVIITSSPMPFK